MLRKLALLPLALSALLGRGSALPAVKRAANDATPRNVIYVQTFEYSNGTQVSLLPLLQQNTQVTHVILAALHINQDPGDITLNDNSPDSSYYDFLWPEVQQLQAAGIKVMIMMGGAAVGSYQRLASNFNAYYPPLVQILKNHSIDGLDLDIEEDVPLSGPLQLLQQLNSDMGTDFILTSAPVASALTTNGPNINNLSYFDLDAQATDSSRPNGKLINWYNAQAYNGWGDAGSPDTYTSIINSGWAASRVVFGVPDSQNDGSGWVSLQTLAGVISTLRQDYSDFGGVFGWEYFDAGTNDNLNDPWEWVKTIGSDLFSALSKRAVARVRKTPKPITPFEPQMAELTSKGVSFGDALVSLNKTGGDLGRAKARLHLA
ncbi:hypothetical protein VTN77DRAFT_1396 [Rasamsonia byssochlamydoides]|uniref:uncharacterized protein n=1 Tax=Rasamsonia byssochlamydoides TaxID=89139 RepID=UPI0037432936